MQLISLKREGFANAQEINEWAYSLIGQTTAGNPTLTITNVIRIQLDLDMKRYNAVVWAEVEPELLEESSKWGMVSNR